MPIFSMQSLNNLNNVHNDLRLLFEEVIKTFDCKILCGMRDEDNQNKAFREGRSKLIYPLSKHNRLPSQAVDVAPYPIDWKDKERFYYFGGYVMGIASQMKKEGIIKSNIRWGGDWDMDTDLHDQNLYDLVHFEIS